MATLPEWITAIGTAVTAGGILFLWRQIDLFRSQTHLLQNQLNVMVKQINDDHERSRRENSVKYLFEWSKGLLRSSSLARRLAETLSSDQTQALVDEETLMLPKDLKDLVLGILPPHPRPALTEDGTNIVVDKRHVAYIRWQLVRYLNILESMFIAVNYGVAEKEILTSQFDYLYKREKGHYLLKVFRDKMGGAKAYPALNKLEAELQQKYGKPEAGRQPITEAVPH